MDHPYIQGMKHLTPLAPAFVLIAVLSSAPLAAQDTNEPGLMQRGVEMFLKGLEQEMAPALEDLQNLADRAGPSMLDFMTEMGPAFGDILDEVHDWSRYSAPEILPNGDIIIRRKPDITPPADDEIDI